MRYSTTAAAVAALVSTALAASDPCAEFAASITTSFSGLDAGLFRNCIENVPFNKENSAKVVKNLRRFMQLESSTDYWIDPPTAELELEPFNLNKTFNRIQSNVEKSVYKNNWSFDYDLVQMFQLFRDGHTDYETDCTHGFFFTHEYPIYLIADKDGKNPAIHHIEYDFTKKDTPKIGAKIVKINGKDAHKYLNDFIKTTPEELNWVDPDARFNNMLFDYPAGTARGKFSHRNMWDGEELWLTWENGTNTMVEFTVSMSIHLTESGRLKFSDTKTLTEVCMPTKIVTTTKPTIEERAVEAVEMPKGYPTPLTYSDEYSMLSYVLADKTTGVIVIRTFSSNTDMYVNAISSYFRKQIASFKKAGIKKIIFDLTGNPGGKAILPYDLILQLFPQSDAKHDAFSTVNMKYSPLTWAYLATLPGGDEDTVWHNANGEDFKDFKDFLGPLKLDGSYYTKLWRQDYLEFADDSYNLTIFTEGTAAYKPEDIILVSNTLCGSACHSFVEGLTARGVRAFAYGGRPDGKLPMQTTGGTKGGKVVEYDTVQGNLALNVNNKDVIALAGPTEDWVLEELPIAVRRIRCNSENKFRKGSTLPLEFTYTPACNRFFLTPEMFTDIEKLWEHVKDVAWDKDGKMIDCVKYQTIKSTATNLAKPKTTDKQGNVHDALAVEGGDEDEGDAWVDLDGDGTPDQLFLSGAQVEWKNFGQIVYKAMRHHGKDPTD